MLKLKNISPSHGESYFDKDNYFSSDDNRAASEWWGKETAALGLKGEVDRRMFSKMLRGQAPSGEKLRIAVHTGSERAGIDCTFSAPKSVSLLALVEGIRAVFEAHRLAILDALKQMENYAMTRVTVEGKRQRVETGNLVIAIHHHDTNRELEPQLHSHCIVLNTTRLGSDLWRSLHNDRIWQNSYQLGVLYQNSLALRLQQLGIEIEPRENDLFEVKGYSPSQIWAFSSRRAQIVEMVGEDASARDKELACLATRKPKKEQVNRQDLKGYWEGQASVEGVVHPQPSAQDMAIKAAVDLAEDVEKFLAFKGLKAHESAGYKLLADLDGSSVRVTATQRGDILKVTNGQAELTCLLIGDRWHIQNMVSLGALTQTTPAAAVADGSVLLPETKQAKPNKAIKRQKSSEQVGDSTRVQSPIPINKSRVNNKKPRIGLSDGRGREAGSDLAGEKQAADFPAARFQAPAVKSGVSPLQESPCYLPLTDAPLTEVTAEEIPVITPELLSKKVEPFWISTFDVPAPEHIAPEHWRELTSISPIHPEIAAQNFRTLEQDSIEGFHEAWSYLFYSDRLERSNTGRLPLGVLNKYAHIEAGGWWCGAGVNARCFKELNEGEKPEQQNWGCYKPNNPRVDVDKPGKIIKYEHPLKSDTSIFLLNVPEQIANRIYEQAGADPSDSDRTSGFWFCVWKHNLPVTITEGAKKAASLLSQGHAAIGLPGIYAGYRSKDAQGHEIKAHLTNELAVFATLGREITFCFDYETKPNTKRNIEIAISRTGSLMERSGSQVSVVSLPGPDKGVDDFMLAQGPLAYESAYSLKLPLKEWRGELKRQHHRPPEPPKKRILEDRIERFRGLALEVANAVDYYVRVMAAGERQEDGWVYEGEHSRLITTGSMVKIESLETAQEILRVVEGEPEIVKWGELHRFKGLVDYVLEALKPDNLPPDQAKSQGLAL